MMCECVAKVNAKLAEHNTALEQAIVVSLRGPGMRLSLLVQTGRLHSRTPAERRSKVQKVMPSFCPFCGKKIDRTLKSEEAGETSHE
jgi:hypothetical protein